MVGFIFARGLRLKIVVHTDSNGPLEPRWLIRRPHLVWLLPALTYIILVVPAVWLRRAQINPDGICYLRLATYILRGDWGHAFSGYWSPLFPWSIVPLMAAGVDGLYAGHVAIAIAGGIGLVTSYRLLRQLNSITPAGRLWIMMIAALVTVHLVVRIVTPDLLMAAVLMGYLAVMARADMFTQRSAFIAGCVAGVAYLAKAYAMPFFLAHFTLTLILRWVAQRREKGGAILIPWKALTRVWLAGLVGFFLLAGPWILLLSHSYGRLTMGTSGPITHNQVAGAPKELRRPSVLLIPPDPYIIENEMFDREITKFWSPFDSLRRLKQQWGIVKQNSSEILRALAKFDGIGLVPLCMFLGAGLGVGRLLMHRREPLEWRGPWLAMTVMVYCSGLTFVYFEPRLIDSALRFPAMLLCVFLAAEFGKRLTAGATGRRWAPLAPPVLVLVVFSTSAVVNLRGAFNRPTRDEFPRQIATAMRAANLPGPFACTNRGLGMYTAWFLDAKLVEVPPGSNADAWERDCGDGGVRNVLLCTGGAKAWDNVPDRGCATMVRRAGWISRLQVDGADVRVEIYSRVNE